MDWPERMLGVALALAMVGVIAWVLHHASRTGELLSRGTSINRVEQPRMFAIFRAAYALVAVGGLIVAAVLAAGYGPF